jgi:hypothetical protein
VSLKAAGDHMLVAFVAAYAVLALPGAAAHAGNSEAMDVQCEVELDIFSGAPNPGWSLAAAEADAFMAQLAALPRVAPRPFPGQLGYRGFVVQCRQGTKAWPVRVHNGLVQVSRDGADTYTGDEQRRLERWLLNTGRPYLKADLLEMAERGLR